MVSVMRRTTEPLDPVVQNQLSSMIERSENGPADQVMETVLDRFLGPLEVTKDMAEAQWETFNTIIKEECKLPIYHCIGNHDVWGWGAPTPDKQSDPLYGKGMALKQLGLKERYYSFDLAGWHFSVLDSTHQAENGAQHPYIGKLDDEQFAWLEADILAVDGGKNRFALFHFSPFYVLCVFRWR
jgi:3',5'-cyclic AMP phosphodiesterase CpdA